MENSEDEEDLTYNYNQQLLFIISKTCENRTTNGKLFRITGSWAGHLNKNHHPENPSTGRQVDQGPKDVLKPDPDFNIIDLDTWVQAVCHRGS